MAGDNGYRRIRHGLFSYYSPTTQIDSGGKEVELFTEHLAFRGQVIKIDRAHDLARGEEYGAFEDERFDDQGNSLSAPAVDPESEADVEEVELSGLDDDELVDWLMATGAFDGDGKPNVQDVLDAAEGDPQLAERLLAAENTATGGKPRQGVADGLAKVAENATE